MKELHRNIDRKNLAPIDEGMGSLEYLHPPYRRVELNEKFFPFSDSYILPEKGYKFDIFLGRKVEIINPEVYIPDCHMLVNVPDLGSVWVPIEASLYTHAIKANDFFIPQDQEINYQVTEEDFDPILYKEKSTRLGDIELHVPNGMFWGSEIGEVYLKRHIIIEKPPTSHLLHLTEDEKKILSRLRIIVEFPNGERYISTSPNSDESWSIDSFHPLDTPPFASDNWYEKGKRLLLLGDKDRLNEIRKIQTKFILVPDTSHGQEE